MEHFDIRVEERFSGMRQVVAIVARSLAKKAKERRLPNSDWYRKVYQDGRIVGYICGRGIGLATFLSGTMVPRGKEV
jgi:hypothetical protein